MRPLLSTFTGTACARRTHLAGFALLPGNLAGHAALDP